MTESIEVTIEPQEVRECLEALGWTYLGFAKMIGVPWKRVRDGKLTFEVVQALRARAKSARANPFEVVDEQRFRRARERRQTDRRFARNKVRVAEEAERAA